MKKLSILIKPFGIMRQFFNEEQVMLKIPYGSSIEQLSGLLADFIKKQHPEFDTNLLKQVAFAKETTIVNAKTTLTQNTTISILPPVSGG